MIQRHAITISICHGGDCFPTWYPQRFNLDENLEDIFYAPSVINVHGRVSPGESGTLALWSGAECSSDSVTAGPSISLRKQITGSNYRFNSKGEFSVRMAFSITIKLEQKFLHCYVGLNKSRFLYCRIALEWKTLKN